MKFKPAKPDARVLIIQIAIAAILSFYFKNDVAAVCFFLVINTVLLFWYGLKVFLKRLLIYAALNITAIVLTTTDIPVISIVFPPFLAMIVRIYPVSLLLKLLADKTPMNELLYSLDAMHLPKSFTIPFMVVYRYVPTIMQEFRYVNEGLKMRGKNSSLSNMRHFVKTVENYMVPLLFRSEKLSEELSAASLCKGLSTGRKRTCCTDVKMTAGDFCYILGIFAVTGGLLYLEFLNL